MRRFAFILLGASLIAVACNVPVADDQATPVAPTGANDGSAREPITIPLTLYRLLDEDPNGLGTQRTAEEIGQIGTAVEAIWSQADIVFDPLLVRDIAVPTELLAPIVAGGNIQPLIDSFQGSIDVSNPGVFNGFYLSAAFGVNGFAPTGSRTFFVVDEPSVPDERVTSHEIGHLLGLHHEPFDAGRLMFSGTDGTRLTTDEQTVARYVAQGVLRDQR